MNGLERELHGLAAAVEWPPTPDLAVSVAARIAAVAPAAEPWWRRRRVVLAVALATLIAALVATLAVPTARSTVLRWFGIGSVRVEHVDEPAPPPAAVPRPPAPVLSLPGQQVTLAEARRAVPYELLDPPAELGRPDHVLLLAPQRIVTFVWGDLDAPRFTVSQLPGEPAPWIVGKLIRPGTSAQQFFEGGLPALWISGNRHEIAVLDPETGEPIFDSPRLAGNTLLVDRGGLTLRVEGNFSRERALEIARSFK